MKIIHNHTLKIKNEIALFLMNYHQGRRPLTESSLKELYGTSYESYLPYLEESMGLHQQVIDFGFPEDDEYNFLFRPFSEVFETECLGLFETENIERLNEYFGSILNRDFEGDEAIDPWILKETFDAQTQLRLLYLLHNPEDVVARREAYLSHFNPLIEKIEKQVMPRVHEFFSSLKDEQVYLLLDRIGIGFSEIEEISISVHFFEENRVSVSVTDMKRHELAVSIGPHLFEINEVQKDKSRNEERFIEGMKLISEKTKFDILKLCLEKPSYGTEIANALGISGATVSHHVNALLNKQYVDVEVDKNRIYYRTNVAKIKEDIALFEEIMGT